MRYLSAGRRSHKEERGSCVHSDDQSPQNAFRAAAMALNQSLAGKTYAPATTEVTLEALQSYARAYNDDNPCYFRPPASRIIAPPMFNAVVAWLPLITAISDPELRVDLLRLLHRRQDMRFFSPIRP